MYAGEGLKTTHIEFYSWAVERFWNLSKFVVTIQQRTEKTNKFICQLKFGTKHTHYLNDDKPVANADRQLNWSHDLVDTIKIKWNRTKKTHKDWIQSINKDNSRNLFEMLGVADQFVLFIKVSLCFVYSPHKQWSSVHFRFKAIQ